MKKNIRITNEQLKTLKKYIEEETTNGDKIIVDPINKDNSSNVTSDDLYTTKKALTQSTTPTGLKNFKIGINPEQITEDKLKSLKENTSKIIKKKDIK